MKTKTTIKSIKNNYTKIFRCGYCDLQDIFKYTDATYYNAGVYGWNCDIYTDVARDVAITTGYRNMAGVLIPDELIKKYSNIAKAICKNSFNKSYADMQKALEENQENFLDELVKIL